MSEFVVVRRPRKGRRSYGFTIHAPSCRYAAGTVNRFRTGADEARRLALGTINVHDCAREAINALHEAAGDLREV